MSDVTDFDWIPYPFFGPQSHKVSSSQTPKLCSFQRSSSSAEFSAAGPWRCLDLSPKWYQVQMHHMSPTRERLTMTMQRMMIKTLWCSSQLPSILLKNQKPSGTGSFDPRARNTETFYRFLICPFQQDYS